MKKKLLFAVIFTCLVLWTLMGCNNEQAYERSNTLYEATLKDGTVVRGYAMVYDNDSRTLFYFREPNRERQAILYDASLVELKEVKDENTGN